ncbi:MAG: 23S rRNA (uracil(1939)-C(5))-methyltransferase RlmD [Solidesulfovibrio sp.]|uniref:23S rRNA (uracil(1939)-C(5))-methyltransferase RlmD n=1 Tax=Solidesulfovibrio sp. TaxID=2910990 RepID=UPI0031596844
MDIREDMELTVDVDRLAYGGKGVARVEGLVVFVSGGLPGATVRAKVTKCKKGFAEAVAVETLSPSPEAVAPPCPHFGVCGGCLWQDLSYEAQLFWKREQVVETLSRLGGLSGLEVAPTVASPRVFAYRNKMEFAFAGRLHLGLHERLRPGRVLDIGQCLLMEPWAGEVLGFVRDTCRETGLAAFDARTNKGVWRHLVLRASEQTGARLAHVITGPARGAGDAAHRLGEALLARFPFLTGFVHSVRRAPTAVAFGERQVLALGADHIEERFGAARLHVSADAFAQTNTQAATALYGVVTRAAGSDARGTAVDCYCGCGGIALNLAPHFETVYGLEADKRAVADAVRSAELSGIGNAVFKAQDAAKGLSELSGISPSVVVLDPPRAGATPEMLAAVLAAAPKKVVYVSCNPATLARDLKALGELYAVVRVTPVDQFPHTAHIEAVAELTLR